jgi:hypothetical protein
VAAEPLSTMAIYMSVSANYAFMVGRLDKALCAEVADELYQITRQAQWRRAANGQDTTDLDALIEAYNEDED